MKFNYEQMKEKFGLKYSINFLSPFIIKESFGNKNCFTDNCFNSPHECISNYIKEKSKQSENKINTIVSQSECIKSYSLTKKIIRPFKYLSSKKTLIKDKNKEIENNFKENERILNLKIDHINKDNIYEIEHPDLDIGDQLFLVSFTKNNFGIKCLKINDINYYEYDNGFYFQISIYASEDGNFYNQYNIVCDDKGNLTNKVFNYYIFKEEDKAIKFLKEEVERNISFYSDQLVKINKM